MMGSIPDPKAIAAALGGEARGNRIAVPSPGHSNRDRGTVLTVDQSAPDGLLVHSFNGADVLGIKDDLRRRGLLPERPLLGDRSITRSGPGPGASDAPKWLQTGCYEYDDGAGQVIYRTRRLEADGKKRFVAERWENGRWINGLEGVKRLPYRFGELCTAAERSREAGEPKAPIYFAEGERKADKLAGMGFLATAIAFGANGWREEYGGAFTGATVVMLPDNDGPGRNFARKVKAGIEDYGGTVKILELPGLPPKGDIIDWQGSTEDLRELTAKALDGPEPDWLGGEPEPEGGIVASPYTWRDPATLPRRPWLYGRQLLRGSVFLLVAPGGTGKSALTTGIALALCTGRPLLGTEVWGGPKRAWLWNLEDAMADLSFSIQGAALHWGVKPGDLEGRLFVDSGLDGAALKLAVQERDGPRIDAAASASIIAELKRRKIDVLVIDPFISSHGLAENDNAAIDLVAKEWSRIASQAGCAVVLVHHSKKMGGETVTAESSRGASSLIDAARGGLALNTMTDPEADRFGVSRDKRRQFFRADNAKANRAPAGVGEWFELVSVHLDNGPDGGDSVGVATPWCPPDPFEDVTAKDLEQVERIIAAGDYRESSQSPDWAGYVVADVLGLDTSQPSDKAKAASILRTWIGSKALVVVRETDGKGKTRPMIRAAARD